MGSSYVSNFTLVHIHPQQQAVNRSHALHSTKVQERRLDFKQEDAWCHLWGPGSQSTRASWESSHVFFNVYHLRRSKQLHTAHQLHSALTKQSYENSTRFSLAHFQVNQYNHTLIKPHFMMRLKHVVELGSACENTSNASEVCTDGFWLRHQTSFKCVWNRTDGLDIILPKDMTQDSLVVWWWLWRAPSNTLLNL